MIYHGLLLTFAIFSLDLLVRYSYHYALCLLCSLASFPYFSQFL